MSEQEQANSSFQDTESKQTRESPTTPDRVAEFLRWVYDHPHTDIAAELELERYNLLIPLEETGVVPKLEDPNPYDPDTQTDAYEQWWSDHPSDVQKFEAAFIRRDQALRDLWLGVVLYRMSGSRLFEGLIESRQIRNRLP